MEKKVMLHYNLYTYFEVLKLRSRKKSERDYTFFVVGGLLASVFIYITTHERKKEQWSSRHACSVLF